VTAVRQISLIAASTAHAKAPLGGIWPNHVTGKPTPMRSGPVPPPGRTPAPAAGQGMSRSDSYDSLRHTEYGGGDSGETRGTGQSGTSGWDDPTASEQGSSRAGTYGQQEQAAGHAPAEWLFLNLGRDGRGGES